MVVRLGQDSDPEEVIADMKRRLRGVTADSSGELDHLERAVADFIPRLKRMAEVGNSGRIEKEFKVGGRTVRIVADTSYRLGFWNRIRARVGF